MQHQRCVCVRGYASPSPSLLTPALVALVVAATMIGCVSAHAGEAVQHWFDDFADGNATDGSPTMWTPNPNTVEGPIWAGDYDASSGSYHLQGQNQQGFFGFFDNDEEVLLASVESDVFSNGMSIRTRGRVNENSEAEPRQLGGMALLANMTTFVASGYLAVVGNEVLDDPNSPHDGQVRGLVSVGSVDVGDANDNTTAGMEDLEPFTDDVIFQTDYFEDEQGDIILSFSYWQQGEAQPTTPVLEVNLSEPPGSDAPLYTMGVGGIGLLEAEEDPMGNGSVDYRWAKASAIHLLDGDMDLDGDVDFDDIDDFVLGLNNSAAYEAAIGLPPVMHGDTDHDGDQDFDDIDQFVDILLPGIADGIHGVPEPSTVGLAAVALGLLGAVATRRGVSG